MKVHIGNILETAREKAQKTRPDVAEYLTQNGFPTNNQAVYRAEKSDHGFDTPRTLLYAHFVGIDDVYGTFLGLESPETEEYMGLAATLAPAGQEFMRQIAKCVVNSREFERTEPVSVRFFPEAVSAGVGNMALDTSTPQIRKIPASDLPLGRRAQDFYVLPVAGNSMEPVLSDGDTILIDSANEPESGEIGVFYYDGDTLVKELSRDGDDVTLLSLNKPGNKDYEITGDMSFSCQGRFVTKTSIVL